MVRNSPRHWSCWFITILCTTRAVSAVDNTVSALEEARQLQIPVPNATDGAEFEAAEFFDQHQKILHRAWNELEDQQTLLPIPMEDFLHPTLREALEEAWSATAEKNTPRLAKAEAHLLDLWKPVAPGVLAANVLQPKGIEYLRRFFDLATSSGIPLRRPNGMNRYGVIVDSLIAGAVPLAGLTSVVQDALIDKCFRPLGRLLFPEYTNYKDKDNDANSFAFTIRYQSGGDLNLTEHSDASLMTMNINLNFLNETYTGSDLYFVDPSAAAEGEEKVHSVTMEAGMALIHRGLTRHAALPLTNGTRTNMILWLFGADDGYVRVTPYKDQEQMTAMQRWTKPMRSSPSPMANLDPKETFNSRSSDSEEL